MIQTRTFVHSLARTLRQKNLTLEQLQERLKMNKKVMILEEYHQEGYPLGHHVTDFYKWAIEFGKLTLADVPLNLREEVEQGAYEIFSF